jgi:hypothetical protein
MNPTIRVVQWGMGGWCTRADETRSAVASFGWIDAFNEERS